MEQMELISPKYQQSISDFGKFAKVCKLKAFCNFQTPEIALENQNDISEGIVSPLLMEFLEQNLAKNDSLGVCDNALSNTLQQTASFKVEKNTFVSEITRGLRLHFPTYIRAYLKDTSEDNSLMFTSERGLAHSYSRARVKFNVHKADNLIINSIATLDQLDKNINTFAMRVREWYSWHFPELVKITNDNILYARCVRFIGSRNQLSEKSSRELNNITKDEQMTKSILHAAHSSMGYDISEFDMKLVTKFSDKVVKLADLRTQLSAYLKSKMLLVAPNLYSLIGEIIGARLISHAGSLTTLAKYPSSTVQILGAEKALFRALKNRSATPKYGLIFNTSYISRAKAKDKGRISRYIANKCSLASRIDAFSDIPTTKYGEVLANQVEERLKFLEFGGETPAKNIDVMKRVLESLKSEHVVVETTPKSNRMEVEKQFTSGTTEVPKKERSKDKEKKLKKAKSKK